MVSNKKKKNKILGFGWKRLLLGIIILAVLVAGIAILHNRSVHKAQHTSGTIPTSKKNNSTKSTVANGSTATKKGSETSGGTKAQGVAVTDSATLIAPFGTFISNHRPGQNGAPNSEQSVCNSTPGATCDIQFSNGNGITKNLGVQTINGNGSTYWSWDINGATLAPGSWQVTAVVKLNGQVKTTTDPTPLEVQ